MKNKLFTVIISIVCSLLIITVIILGYDHYKTKKQLYKVNKQMDQLSTNYENNIFANIEPFDSTTLASSNLRTQVKETSRYKEIINKGIEKIDDIDDALNDFSTIYALEDITKCNVAIATKQEWQQPAEFKKIWFTMVKNIRANVYDIMNSEDSVEKKLDKINKYGVLAQPIMKSICDDFSDTTSLDNHEYKIIYKFNKNEKSKIKKYVNNYNLTDDEQVVLSDYIKN